MFEKLDIELKFRDKLYGTLSGNSEVFQSFMKARFDSPENTENIGKDLDLDEEIAKSTNIFRKDEIGIYVGAYQVKAMIAQCGSLLELTVSKRGSKQTLKEATFVKGYDENGGLTGDKVYLLPLKQEADGTDEFTGTVFGVTGRRGIITHAEYCTQPTLRFQMWILNNRVSNNGGKKITHDDYRSILELAQEVGLGAMRNMEHGKFDLIRFERSKEG